MTHKTYDLSDLIGKSPAMVTTRSDMDTASDYAISLIITGETGTGKGLAARIIHDISNRRQHPYVAVNCAALNENLVESELFGYERGAFTSALRTGKEGIFEFAGQGTLFLDELTRMPLSTQEKLLTVLQNREYRRVGGTKTLHTNARIIAATSMYLWEAVAQGKLLDQLMYRLNVLTIHLPPLRDRDGDKFVLAEHFLDRYIKEYKRYVVLTDSAMEFINLYHWPGNVRELENTIEAVVVRNGSRTNDMPIRAELSDKHLSDVVHHPSRGIQSENTSMTGINGHKPAVTLDNLHEFGGLKGIGEIAKRDAEIPLIRMALDKYNGAVWKAARELRIGNKTLLKKIKAYGL